MNDHLRTIAATIMAAVLIGCSEKSPPGRLDAAPAEGVPVTPNAEATVLSQAAGEAIKKKSYMEAVATVVQMGQTPGMTPEQIIAYKNLRRDLQASLSAAAADGDTKAQEAIQMLRMSTTPMR